MKKNLLPDRSPQGDQRKKSSIRLTRIGIVSVSLIVLALGVGTVVFSQNGGKRSKTVKTPPPVADGKAYVAGQEIRIDPATGKLRKPTAEETKVLVETLKSLTNRTTDGLTARTHPDGTKQVNLNGRFSAVVLARPNADGTSEIRCVTTMEEAAAFLGLQPDSTSGQ